MRRSKPISGGHSKSLNPNQPRHNIRLQQWLPIPPLSQPVFCPNVPSSKKNGWRARNVFEEMPTIATHLEGRLHLHPPPTPDLMTMNLADLQPKGNICPHRDRAGPFSSLDPSNKPPLSVDLPKPVLARTSCRCFGGAR